MKSLFEVQIGVDVSGGGKRRGGDTAFNLLFKEEDILINQFKVKFLIKKCLHVLKGGGGTCELIISRSRID